MSLRMLRWITVLAPLAFLATVDAIRHVFHAEVLHAWPGYLLVGGVVLFGTLLFSDLVLNAVGRAQAQMANQNRELSALHEAGLAIASDLGLDVVLQKIVDQAQELIGSRFGALLILRKGGGVDVLVTSGRTETDRAEVTAPPPTHPLVNGVLTQGQRLRIADGSRGAHHADLATFVPPVHDLLAVPVVAGGTVVGILYLGDKWNAPEFSHQDEETLVRFATQVTVAMENAQLHHQLQAMAIVEERERIAREMHDSLAQVLGYVNTKAQASQELLAQGQTERASGHLGQLAEAARSAYVDVRESILALRTSLGPDRTLLDALRDYLQTWEQQSAVTTELVDDVSGLANQLSQEAELQLLRIVQEALSNVRKHAGASHVWVRLSQQEDSVEAEVEDDGTGFDIEALGRAAFPRFGLATMRERAESVGGTLQIDSVTGRGTRVIARFPIASAERPSRPTTDRFAAHVSERTGGTPGPQPAENGVPTQR
jgi:signal transduction histidine kinase